MRCTRTIAICGLALAVSSVASAAPNKEHLQLMAEIRMLQEQQQQLQQLIGALQDTLKAVNTKLDEQSAATRKAMADQTLAVTNINDNVRMLREKTDETNVRVSQVSQEIDSLRQAVASQPPPQTSPTGTGMAPGVTPPGPGVGPGPATTGTSNPPPVGPPPGVSMQKMYDASWDDYTAGRYDLAIEGFKTFIRNFGPYPMAAQAQFYIGQSYYAQSKWPDARDAYQAVITNYPQSDIVPDAYYKLGQTFEQLKQVDNAKRAYDTVVQKYQSSPSFNLARQALDRLSRR
jgi:tol-pal system protein YbgF